MSTGLTCAARKLIIFFTKWRNNSIETRKCPERKRPARKALAKWDCLRDEHPSEWFRSVRDSVTKTNARLGVFIEPTFGGKQQEQKIKHGLFLLLRITTPVSGKKLERLWIRCDYSNDNLFQEFVLGKKDKLGTKFAIVAGALWLI